MAAYVPQTEAGRTAIDPDVKVPDAVKAAAARANALYTTTVSGETVPEPEAPQTPPDAEQAPAPTQASPPVTEAPKPPQEPPVTTQGNQPPAGEDSWEHRYRSLDGRFRRSEQQRTEMSNRMAGLERLVATLQTPPATAPTAPPPVQSARLITPEEEADYGTEFLSVVGKRAKEEIAPELANLRKDLDTIRGQVGNVAGSVVQSARDKMHADLDNILPQWRQLNVNENFLNWLALPDPYSGGIRHNLLKEAYGRNQTARVAAFFRGFLSQEAAMRPAPTNGAGGQRTTATTKNGAGGQPPKVTLADLAAPGRAKTAAPSSPAEKPVFTRAEITRFYADISAGRYAGRDAEKNKIENDIFEASRDGRVT